MPSLTVENYVKAIYQICVEQGGEPAATGQLAAALGVSANDQLVLTATDANGNTSEFSTPVTVADTIEVTNTNDFGPGSLRQAIYDANATPGTDTITFAAGVPTPDLGVLTAASGMQEADH